MRELNHSRKGIRPRIEDVDPRHVVLLRVARNDRKAVVLPGGRDDKVGLRESMPRLAALIDQETPLEHDVLGYRQYSLLEHRSHLMGKPIVQFGTARSIRQPFDAEAYFGESDNADVKRFEGLTPDERDDLRFRLRAAKLGNDVGIE